MMTSPRAHAHATADTEKSADKRRSLEPAPEKSPNPLWSRLATSLGTGGTVQPKLTVSPPDDPYEREADQVAERVLRLPDPELGGDAAQKIRSLRGGGEPLSSSSLDFFQPRFRADLSGVRVHTGAGAAEQARGIRARAFTFGKDIAFEAGEYRPESTAGRRLLAHELTHVMQQSGGDSQVRRQSEDLGAATADAAPDAATAMLLVEDDEAPEASQMRKQEFLAAVRTQVCQAAEEVLAPTGQTTGNCPYLNLLFPFLERQSASYLERTLRRFAPELQGAASARAYIPFVVERVRAATAHWVATGEIAGLPEGLPPSLKALAGLASGGGGLLSTAASLLFKARPGSTTARASPAAVRARLGSGRPLEGGVRSRMESAFGSPFSHVRTHTDPKTASLSSQLRARAFTVGEHVAFGPGEYRPGTLIGDALIAHELAHVIQQGGTAASGMRRELDGGSTAALELDADRSAVGALASLWSQLGDGIRDINQQAVPRFRSGLRLQRCKSDDTPTSHDTPTKSDKELRIEALEAERDRLTDLKGDSNASFGEVASAITKLKDVEHDLAVETKGVGLYYGKKSDEAEAGTAPAGVVGTDCTEIVLEVLADAFEAQGRAEDWKKVKKKYREYEEMRGGGGLSGLDVQAALQSELGWKGIYWAPDPSYQIPKEHLSKANPDEASYTKTIAEKGTYLKDFGKKKGYPGAKVAHTVVDYAPEDPNAGYGSKSSTTKDTSSLAKLAKIPFGVLTAHGAHHMTLITYGKVIEVHWKEESDSVRVITQDDLASWAVGSESGYHYFASGVIVAPASDVDKAFE